MGQGQGKAKQSRVEQGKANMVGLGWARQSGLRAR
jgi:hypothetical protein